jgi:hypothetical protein
MQINRIDNLIRKTNAGSSRNKLSVVCLLLFFLSFSFFSFIFFFCNEKVQSLFTHLFSLLFSYFIQSSLVIKCAVTRQFIRSCCTTRILMMKAEYFLEFTSLMLKITCRRNPIKYLYDIRLTARTHKQNSKCKNYPSEELSISVYTSYVRSIFCWQKKWH